VRGAGAKSRSRQNHELMLVFELVARALDSLSQIIAHLHNAPKSRSIELIFARDLLQFVCAGHIKLSWRDAGFGSGANAGVGAGAAS
jgi:hypothetical protein